MSLSVEGHGGNCCGIHHIYGFNNTNFLDDTVATKRSLIREAIADALRDYEPDPDAYDYGSWRTACEVVLAAYQLSEWREALEAEGFKEVFSFINSNSDNRCHVFYFATNSEGDRA